MTSCDVQLFIVTILLIASLVLNIFLSLSKIKVYRLLCISCKGILDRE